MSSKWVCIGSVRRFDDVNADKAQALKPLEESSEVFGTWQAWKTCEGGPLSDYVRDRLLDSCADVVQSVINLAAALGVEDFRPYMKACERRNRNRGRISDGVE